METDADILERMLVRAGISYSVISEATEGDGEWKKACLLPDGQTIDIGGIWPPIFKGHADTIECYGSFYTQFVFDKDGALRKVRIFE